MDLLTVLEHELGHLLGYEHDETGVMIDTLSAGTRRTPTPWPDVADADWLFDLADAGGMLASAKRSKSNGGHGKLCHLDPICK